MTVNISLSDGAKDGGLRSSDSGSYSNALAGSVFIGGSGGASSGWGAWYVDGIYNAYQTFLYFSYTPPAATTRIVSAALRVYCTETYTASVSRELRAYEYNFGTSVTSADWRNTAWFAANGYDVEVTDAQNATAGQYIEGGSGNLVDRLAEASPLQYVVTSSRVVGAAVPTGNEFSAVALGGASGTATDPALVWTTIPASTHVHVSGAQVRLSTGSWAYLESNGAASPTITLKHQTTAGVVSTIASVPIGASSTDFLALVGLQTLALVVDASDNLYVIGPRGDGLGALILVQPYRKESGTSWTALTSSTYGTLSYDREGVRGVAATWHNAGTAGTIMAVTARSHGDWNQTPANDVTYALLSCNYLLNGVGSLVRNSGSAVGTLLALASDSSRYSTPANEVGTSLDVQAPSPAGTRGYVFSLSGRASPGELASTASARYALAADGSSLTAVLASSYPHWAVKDAASKARVLAITDTTYAVVTMDSDTGYGPSFTILQNVGSSSSFTRLAYIRLDGQGIASLPSAATLAVTAAWDAAYDTADNKLWLYYIDTANARRIVRTAVDLNSYQALLNEVQVTASLGTGAASVARSLRVERNARTGDDNILVSAAVDTSGTLSTSYYVDSFNQAPNAPTLVPRDNFDSAASATFSWVFSDPNASDAQSAFEVDINTSASVSAYDSGKLASANEYFVLPASSIANSGSYQWRVRVYDVDDAVSPWSGYGTFQTSASGTVTITDPATDNPTGAITDDYTVAWSVAGTTQVAYRVVVTRTDTSVVLVDSGWVTSTDEFYTITGMLSRVEYQIAVTVRNGASVESGTGTRLITPDYSSPETPTITVTDYAAAGYILVDVTNPEPGTPDLGTVPWTFEVGVTEFEATNCTIEQSSTQAYTGTYSAKVTTTGTPEQAYVRQTDANAVAVTPGTRYAVTYWAYSTSGYSVLADAIDWFDADMAYLDTSSTVVSLAASAWTLRSRSADAPASAAYAKYGPTIADSPPTGTVLYIDDLLFAVASDRPAAIGNQIHRRRADGTGSTVVIVDETDLGTNGTYQDYTAASDVAYEYRARAVAATGTADSTWAQETLTLQGVWLHNPTDPEGTAKQYLYGRSQRSESINVVASELQFAGRTFPVVTFGEGQDDTWTVRIVVPHGPTWAADTEALREFAKTRQALHFRDNRGRAAYCALSGYRADDQDEGTNVSLSIRRVDWIEVTV